MWAVCAVAALSVSPRREVREEVREVTREEFRPREEFRAREELAGESVQSSSGGPGYCSLGNRMSGGRMNGVLLVFMGVLVVLVTGGSGVAGGTGVTGGIRVAGGYWWYWWYWW